MIVDPQDPPGQTPESIAVAAAATRAVGLLQSAGHETYWAGGCVRDLLLGREPHDYDIATSASPDVVLTLFPGAIAVGKSFGVVLIRQDSHPFEVATFREDHDYVDGRHPSAVTFTDAQTDAQRRDFTINALFYDPLAKVFHDFVGGQQDARDKRIRCVGDPASRFREDRLRLLRAVRFATTLGFSIDPETEQAIVENAPAIGSISAERIRDELTRILLESQFAGQALVALDRLALLEPILPEVVRMKGQVQPPQFHPEGDVFTHTVLLLDSIETRTRPLVYAALLHDIGKPPTAHVRDGRVRFDKHAPVGADMAEAILKRLRFSNEDIRVITACVANHMRFGDVPKMKPSTLRKFVGSPDFPLELELHRWDCLSSHRDLSVYQRLIDYQKALADEPVLPPAWISGRDLLSLGLSEGPEIGSWLSRAYARQLDGDFEGREAVLAWLKEAVHAPQEPPDS